MEYPVSFRLYLPTKDGAFIVEANAKLPIAPFPQLRVYETLWIAIIEINHSNKVICQCNMIDMYKSENKSDALKKMKQLTGLKWVVISGPI